ncbi:MAG: hypothetical protein L0287_21495 [Anaerolineae bacterium]|nr:hypothetical protein [Anaerolineae bacterium]MCI0610119.1 hypothetical protein [Anaerolineae bacterium]
MSNEDLAQLSSLFKNLKNSTQSRKGSIHKAVSLDLSNRRLSAIPRQVFEYPQIEILDLHNNHLFRLPDEIACLTNLKILINLWDFGGQEIMHATHQFFLTKRSLYILVLDARLTQEENRVEYWLKIIQSFGGESPIIIVGNKTDEHPLDIDRTGLQKKYPTIAGILETSAATGIGISELQQLISQIVETLPHIHDLLPETWFIVKTRLESLGRKRNYFTRDEFLIICDANGVNDEISQYTLIGFLHDLGVILHFQEDPRLEALGILNPQWVTNGVYKIINSNELFQNKGVLNLPMLNRILDMPEYPRDKRLFIVDMMKKFELCYDIEPDKFFLIPDLLPKDEPYTGEWDRSLAFQYDYNILPSSIITRFIVRMSAFIHKTVWRSGVVLKRNSNTAMIKADAEDRKIYVWISGEENTRRDFLAAIRVELDAIHKTIAKIEAIEKIPIPNFPNANPIDYKLLLQLEGNGITTHYVQSGDQLVEVNVSSLLNGIEPENIRAEKSIILNIGGDIRDSTVTIGNENTITITKNVFRSIYYTIEESSRDEADKTDLKADLKEIEIEITKGEEANESFLSRRLRALKKTAPDIADVVLATLIGPGTAISTIVKKVANKIKDETK